MTTSSAHYGQEPRGEDVESLAEQLRRKDVQPIRSADDLTREGVFEDEEELTEFLAYTYAARRAELA